MSNLFDTLVAGQGARRADLCTIARIKTHMSAEDVADLDRALTAKQGGQWLITGAAIARQLNVLLGDKAFGIKGPTVMRHRNGLCDCR